MANTIQIVYTRKNDALNITRTISCSKERHPKQTWHAFNRKAMSAAALYRKIQCFTAIKRKGADLK